jgi:hypothetical protein
VECRGFSACHGPFLSSDRWEVVQSVVHQTLDLIILVRVQASQPIQISPFSVTGWSKTNSCNGSGGPSVRPRDTP